MNHSQVRIVDVRNRGRFAVAAFQGGEIEGSLRDGQLLLEHFAFGWQVVDLVLPGFSLDRLKEYGISSAYATYLFERVHDPAPKDDQCLDNCRADSGSDVDVTAIRALTLRSQNQAIGPVVVSSNYAMARWWGNGGGEMLFSKTEGHWREISGGGGCLGLAEIVKHDVPTANAGALFRRFPCGPLTANMDRSTIALSTICAKSVTNGTVAAYATDSSYALVACGGKQIKLQIVAQKTGPTWSLLFSNNGKIDFTTMKAHGVPDSLAATLVTVLPAAPTSNSTLIPHVVVVDEIFSPAVQISGTEWLVDMVTITGLDGTAGIVMRIPCTASDPSAGEIHKTSVSPESYFNYGCMPQVIPAGQYKGLLVTQDGQIIARPPQ